MRFNNYKKVLAFFCVLFLIPISINAQGTEIAMEGLSRMFRIIGNVALVVALTNLFLLVVYWITKKNWLVFPILILSMPSLLFGLAAYHDDPWIAKITLLSGSLPLLVLIFRKIFKVKF